jgi:hypothetical protein
VRAARRAPRTRLPPGPTRGRAPTRPPGAATRRAAPPHPQPLGPIQPSSLTLSPLPTPPPPPSFWKGKSSEADLVASFRAVDEEAWAAQRAAGVSRVALDGTYYDQVLDMVAALGVAPERFQVRW